MLIHELTRTECLEVLNRNEVGRLGCARNNQPYVVPIHYSLDGPGNCVYGFSMVGQKIFWMRENPQVCLEVEEVRDKNHWLTVVANGRYTEIQGESERAHAEQLFALRPEWWLPAAAKLRTSEHDSVVVYRIQIDSLTGRRAARGAL